MCEGWIKNYVHDTKGPRVQNTYVIVRDLMEGLVEFLAPETPMSWYSGGSASRSDVEHTDSDRVSRGGKRVSNVRHPVMTMAQGLCSAAYSKCKDYVVRRRRNVTLKCQSDAGRSCMCLMHWEGS
jgi:hypothetical protein